MALLHFLCNRTSFPSSTLILSFKPISSTPKRTLAYAKVPARDRVIDFGKYKGKMLGALPSKYLTWVSKNLRARDFEEWAKLADEVLEDPVYRDRLEWESAERILSGDDSRASRTQTPVSDLAEMSERFGWDSENKDAWRRVDFALLGTSKGGRIPRIGSSDDGKMEMKDECELGFAKKKDMGLKGERRLGFLQKRSGVSEIDEMGVLQSKRERKFGVLNGDSGVSGVGGMSSSTKDSEFKSRRKLGSSIEDLGLRGERKLGFLQTKPGGSEIEEMGSLELKRERKFGELNRDSGVYGVGLESSPSKDSRFKSRRNFGSLGEQGSEERVKVLGKESRVCEARKVDSFEGRKVGFLSTGSRYYDTKDEDFEEEMVRGKREERRERQRLRRNLQMQRLKSKVRVKEDGSDRSEIQEQTQKKRHFNPFPGREALLRKWSLPMRALVL